MKVIAVNGSPRKTWNTAELLKKALEGAASTGADTKLIHLYDLNFKGCTSCFACKRENSKWVGHCAMKDDLTDVLEEILTSDVLLIGSPIYLWDVTGETRSFFERLVFANLSYDKSHRSDFAGKISTGFIYTMNITEDMVDQCGYRYIFEAQQRFLTEILNGTSEYLVTADTYQFDDYSKYNASKFDERHKAQVKESLFPVSCQNAFQMGARLTAELETNK
ncbi:flavodoxin family protein [Lacrimispora indolis]|uniref:flavodoxin family protein n=1 Tax=Lacrimispora indolis TaxID=69825 RepID=UPI000462692F|nr:flavodoxin family protein [[Clostridium] methoxybenzovorans]